MELDDESAYNITFSSNGVVMEPDDSNENKIDILTINQYDRSR